MNRNDAIIRKSVTSRANIDDLSSESTMNSFITTTTVMNTSPNRKHCHASDKVIKLLALYLQQANSEQELYDNGTIVSLSTYHLEKLNEKLSDFELTQKREANQNKILKWIMDNIVNSYDTAQVTNNDLEIIMEKFKTIVSNIEIFYKKLKRFENSNESEKITLDLSYFQFLKEIRITGKSSTCTFNLGSILNSNDSLRQITFYRNVIVDSFDKIVNSQTNKLIFIDCPLLIEKMEKDDCFGKSILEHTESLSIENCEITEINNFIFKEGREWKNLKNFKLSKTNVDKILIPGVNVPNLSDLCLHHNSISNIKFSKNNSICSVNLTVLDLSFNLLENLDYFSVVKLPNLEIADVSNNYLENVIGLLQACDKDRLKQVYLHGNNILEWNQIYPLTYFDSLEALTLVENPLQKEEPDYLKVILNLFSNKTRPEFYFDGDIYYLDALPKYPFEIIDPKSILITLPPPPVDIPPPPTGIPPPPMMGGIPPPPGVPPPPGGFLKPKVKKEVSKTKNIHWKPIRNTKDKVKSVWVLEEEDEEVDEEQKAIFEKLDNLFSAKKTTAPTTKKNPKKAIDDELNTIIDSSLARNLEILVNGLFKYCELNVLLEAINTMNIETLTIDQIKGLSQFVPATEEIVKKKEIVEKYFDNLRPSLLWTWKLAEISILPIRLQLMQHMKTFDTTRITDVITAKLNTVDNLQNSKAFVKLLHMLLKVGNYMNRGKAQLEEAQGFHLNILPKLSDTKSSINPKTTLVHFLAETLKNEKSELFNFEVELESYGVCSSDIFNIKLDMIQQDLKEIQDVRELFQSKKSDIETVKKKEKNHKIEANFSTFLKQCNQSVSEVESLFEKLNNSYKMACDFFHFDPTADEALTLPGDPLLIIVKDFVNHFKKAKDDLDKEEKKNQQALKRTLTLKRIQSESKILNSPSSLPSSPSSPLTPLSPLTPTTPTTPSTPPISTKSVDFLKKRQLSIRSKSYSDLDDENSLSPLLKARASLKKGSGLRNVKAASDFATPEKESIETTPVGTSDTPEKLNSTLISATTENDDPNEEKVTLVEDVDQLIFGTENQSAPQQDESVTPSEIICKNDEISAPENTPEQISIENTPETGLPTVNESIESVEISKEENKATLDLSNPEEGEIIDATKPVEIISTNHEITKNSTEMDDISSSTAPYVETKSVESISQETLEKTDNYQIEQIEEEIEVGENEEKAIVMEDPNTSSVSKQSEHENHEFEQLEEMQEELVEENKSIPQDLIKEQNIETSQEIETVFHKEVESDEFKENIIQTEVTQIEEQVVPPTETKLEQPQSENVKTENIDKLNSEMEAVVEQLKVEEPAKVIGVEPKIESVSPEPQKPKKNKKNKNKNKKNKKK